MNKTVNWSNRFWRVLSLALAALAVFIFISCTGNDTGSPDSGAAEKQTSGSDKLKWVDMLLRPGDTTKYDWVEQLDSWPSTQRIAIDSTDRAEIGDLTLALSAIVYKSVEMDSVAGLAGCRVEIIMAGRHVPDHMLMADFSIDSAEVFLPGETVPAGRRLMFPSRRKYMEGVWQVDFLTSNESYEDLDFPEGTRLRIQAYVSWHGKSLVFELPPHPYEYIESPEPITP